MSDLSSFFKESDASLGVFYPKHYILAAFPNFEEAEAARQTLLSSGVAESEVLAARGVEVRKFLEKFREDTGLVGEAMRGLSRFIDTEVKFADADIEHARQGAGFLAVHSLEEAESRRIAEIVKPLHPLSMQWYLPSGVESLV